MNHKVKKLFPTVKLNLKWCRVLFYAWNRSVVHMNKIQKTNRHTHTQTHFSARWFYFEYILTVIGGFFSWKLIHLEGLILGKSSKQLFWANKKATEVAEVTPKCGLVGKNHPKNARNNSGLGIIGSFAQNSWCSLGWSPSQDASHDQDYYMFQ